MWKRYLGVFWAIGFTLVAILALTFNLTQSAHAQNHLVSLRQVDSVDRTTTDALASSSIITVEGRHLTRDGIPFEVHGVNYYPKDHAWDRFWISYTTAITQIDIELDLARDMGVNALRIFVSYDLFDGTDQTYLDRLKDLVDRLQARDMVAIVTLFDLYTSSPYANHLASQQHISAVVNTLGVTNPTVLAWDIKNEPDRDYVVHGENEVKDWLQEMISYTRELDPNHLITIGFYGAVPGALCYNPSEPALVYSPTIVAEFAPLVDVVSMHYFSHERCFEGALQALRVQVGNRPILLEEFGLHTMNTGDDPHTESEQAAYYNTLLSLAEAYDMAGHLFWTLNDFSYILPGTEETHHCQGIVRNSLADTCQVTATVDYTEKPAAETTLQHYTDYIYYLDLFDGWVVPQTAEPPAGWSDNGAAGGAYLRGYKPSDPLWSQDLGKVALYKTDGTGANGIARASVLQAVDVERYPILAGQVYSYSVRDTTYGSDAILYISIQQDTQITRLLTVTTDVILPYTFTADLRDPPLNWTGNHTFSIALELVPVVGDDGYSAAYEFDWIALESAMAADFVAAPRTGVLPLTVRFANTSTGDYSTSLWDFGDTVNSTLKNPTHTYTMPGVYTVTLTISGPGGASEKVRQNYIVVTPLTVTLPVVQGGWQTFGDTCARLYFTDTGSVSVITVTLTYTYPTAQTNSHPLPRRYDIAGNGSDFTAMLALCYADDDWMAAGVTQESNLQLYRYEGGGHWDPYPSLVNTITNLITATQVTNFSTWAIGAAPGHEPTVIIVHRLGLTKAHARQIGIWLVVGIVCVGVWWVYWQRRKAYRC